MALMAAERGGTVLPFYIVLKPRTRKNAPLDYHDCIEYLEKTFNISIANEMWEFLLKKYPHLTNSQYELLDLNLLTNDNTASYDVRLMFDLIWNAFIEYVDSQNRIFFYFSQKTYEE